MRLLGLFILNNRVIAGVVAVALCWPIPEITHALELFDDFQVHGFLTQGYFLTSDNRMFGTSDAGGSFDYTEAGLNGSWTPDTNLRLAAQVLFRRAGVGHENDVELDFGLLDYTFLSTFDYRLGARLGRFKIPYGLYNQYLGQFSDGDRMNDAVITKVFIVGTIFSQTPTLCQAR